MIGDRGGHRESCVPMCAKTLPSVGNFRAFPHHSAGPCKPLNRGVWQLQRTTAIVLIHICILEVETAVVRYDSGLIYVNGCKSRIPVLWSSREGVGRGHEECGLSCR